MEKQQRVIIYGDTVVLSGVRLSLEACTAFEVIALDASHAGEQDLLALHPDVIIFDTSSVRPQFHYDLIRQGSGLQLIGINPDNNQVLLWSGQDLRELSVPELVSVIQVDFLQKKESHSDLSRGLTPKNKGRRRI